MNQNNEITRRSVIVGIVAAAAVPLLSGQALAGTRARAKRARALARRGVTALPRYLHSAVTLQDGRVFITGGYHVDEATRQRGFVAPSANSQIFDPEKNEWSTAASMTHPRARHASVLLPDGRVAVLGGFYTGPLDSAEIYDPSTNTWTKGTKLPQPMCDHTACLAQGRIIVSGGPAGSGALVLTAVSMNNRQTP
jgi:type II secretory pathway pseudopilin PulG